jgi:hypothetical protein
MHKPWERLIRLFLAESARLLFVHGTCNGGGRFKALSKELSNKSLDAVASSRND